jgi:hypothetical protein
MGPLVYIFCSVLVLFGRMIGQLVASRREAHHRRQDQRAQVLANAWRNIAGHAENAAFAEIESIRNALLDVQLFGTATQIELAAEALGAIQRSAPSRKPVTALLESLRADLRREMALCPTLSPLVSSAEHGGHSASTVRPAARRSLALAPRPVPVNTLRAC